MHVKVSGSYSRVSQIWVKVSGTWTRAKLVLVKISPITILGYSHSWAANYFKYDDNSIGGYTVNGSIYWGQDFGAVGSERWHRRPGSYVHTVNVTLGSWPTWHIFAKSESQTICCYDGQTVSYPYTGHNHYAGNTTYNIVSPAISSASTPANTQLYFLTDTYSSSSTLTLNTAPEIYRVS